LLGIGRQKTATPIAGVDEPSTARPNRFVRTRLSERDRQLPRGDERERGQWSSRPLVEHRRRARARQGARSNCHCPETNVGDLESGGDVDVPSSRIDRERDEFVASNVPWKSGASDASGIRDDDPCSSRGCEDRDQAPRNNRRGLDGS
jgi:hypothetical protein